MRKAIDFISLISAVLTLTMSGSLIYSYLYIKNPDNQEKTKAFVKEVYEWGRNSAKWEAAREYCRDRNMDFIILTEDHLMPKYK